MFVGETWLPDGVLRYKNTVQDTFFLIDSSLTLFLAAYGLRLMAFTECASQV